MNENTTPRGIQAVHAENSLPELIRGVNVALGEFKAKNDTRLDAIERQLEQDATIAASRQMGNFDTKPASRFQAHYAKKPDYLASTEPIGMQDFLRGVAGMKTSEPVRAALSSGVGSEGGFSVPSRLAPQILDAMTAQSSVLTAGAGVELIDAASTYTTVIVDSVPTAAWRSEAGSIAESDPSFRGAVGVPYSGAFYFKISREVLADGQGLDAALTNVIGQSFAILLDGAALRGSGVAPVPRGLLNTTNVHAVTSGANGTALTNYSKLFEGVTSILSADHAMPNAAIMHPRSLVKLGSLLDTTNQPLNVPTMLQGVKLLQTSQIPTNLVVGTSNDCSEMYLGDFTQMKFIMREVVSIQLLRESFALTGQLAFVGHIRADVVVTRPKSFAIISGVRA